MARRRRANIKSKEEAKVERRTWLALAGVFILLSLFDPENTLPDYSIAFAISGILMVSGIYQFMQSDDNETWRVSPITWIVAAILGLFATFYVLSDFRGWFRVPLDLRLISLGATYFIIIMGILTNEA
ncbi:MAG: hypothetical protein Phog2KO_04650 [Phototrophicaceae bacterium]